MKTITLVCKTCNKEFEKEKKEHNRRIKKGKTDFYCGLSCSGKSENQKKHLNKIRSNFPIWNVDSARKSKDEYSEFRPVLKSCKQRKVKGGKFLEFDLTLEYLHELWISQNGECPFTKFKLELKTYDNKSKLKITSASLDRIDNSKGYIIGNVRFVSVMFNYARNFFSDEDVILFSKAVVSTWG